MTAFITFLMFLSSWCPAEADTGTDMVVADSVAELPLPEIPATLRAPRERAAYLMEHFWDSLDPADTARLHDSRFMEQNFVNFVNLYQHADSARWHEPTLSFLTRVTAAPRTRALVYELIEMYLSDPQSPVRSDDVYIEFLSQWTRLPGLDTYELEEPRYRLAAALKNRPGTPAADFDFITRHGNATSLYSQPGVPTLLLLYDPDCEHCMEVIAKLRNDETLAYLIEKDRIKVVAVCVEGDRDLWSRTEKDMPREWTVGIDDSGILDNELYDIPELPGIYLLDSDRKVILRDPVLEKLQEALAGL